MTISLFKDLKSSGWHSSIMTTFSVDPAFYDASVAWRLRTYGSENNILLADARMLARALEASPEAFRDAGRKYLIVPCHARGCFHPKVHLRLGKNGARLVVGSANATAAGWGRNKEVVTAFEWSRVDDDPARAALGPLMAKAYAYLRDCLDVSLGEAIEYKLRLHRRDAAWLSDLEPNSDAIELPDGTAVDLLSARGDGQNGLLANFIARIDGDDIRRLTIISPYWDRSLDGLNQLLRALKPTKTVIGLNSETNEFPIDQLKTDDSLQFMELADDSTTQRFLHAKIIIAEGQRWEHVLFGSANCSDDALGGAVASGRNAESCVYRRMRRGETASLLELDYSRRVATNNIKPVSEVETDEDDEEDGFDPGCLEIFGKTLTWWPNATIDNVQESHALLGQQASPFLQRGNIYEARLGDDVAYPLIVRVRLSDGRISSPTIVQNQQALRQAAPGLMDRGLRLAFDRVFNGDEDIIDLALQAQVLFQADEPEVTKSARANRGRASSMPLGHGDMKTAAEFRSSVEASAKLSATGEISLTDPGLLELLRIVMRGVMDVGGRNDQVDDDDLTVGENEDGEEGRDGNEPPVALPPKPPRRFSSTAIEMRCRKLVQAIAAFERMIEDIDRSGAPVTSRLAAQTNFIISLMLYACTYENKLDDGSSVRLMQMLPEKDNRDVFAVLAVRLLKRIWVGPKPIAARMLIDRRFVSLPDDICAFVVMTRWAIGRVVVSSLDLPQRNSFREILIKAALQIFEATGKQVVVGSDFEVEFMRKLDASLGLTQQATDQLVAQCRELVAQLQTRSKLAGK